MMYSASGSRGRVDAPAAERDTMWAFSLMPVPGGGAMASVAGRF
jgi:hypothetical protein